MRRLLALRVRTGTDPSTCPVSFQCPVFPDMALEGRKEVSNCMREKGRQNGLFFSKIGTLECGAWHGYGKLGSKRMPERRAPPRSQMDQTCTLGPGLSKILTCVTRRAHKHRPLRFLCRFCGHTMRTAQGPVQLISPGTARFLGAGADKTRAPTPPFRKVLGERTCGRGKLASMALSTATSSSPGATLPTSTLSCSSISSFTVSTKYGARSWQGGILVSGSSAQGAPARAHARQAGQTTEILRPTPYTPPSAAGGGDPPKLPASGRLLLSGPGQYPPAPTGLLRLGDWLGEVFRMRGALKRGLQHTRGTHPPTQTHAHHPRFLSSDARAGSAERGTGSATLALAHHRRPLRTDTCWRTAVRGPLRRSATVARRTSAALQTGPIAPAPAAPGEPA